MVSLLGSSGEIMPHQGRSQRQHAQADSSHYKETRPMPQDTLVPVPEPTKHLPRFRRAALEERPAFRLTERDREAMKIIYENRYITAELLQDLLTPVPLTDRQKEAIERLRSHKKANAAGPPQRTKREIRRRLQYLYHHGYVQRHKIADGEAIAYALGNLGGDELMLSFGIDRKEIDWTTKNRESTERYIRHALMALMVTRFRQAIEMSVRDVADLTLALWEPGGAFHASIQYEDRVRTRGGTRTQLVDGVVIPDSLFVL